MSEIQKDGNRFGYSSVTFSDLIEKFDISRFPDFENAAEPYLAYVIMSRPDLNLQDKNNVNTLANNVKTSGFFNDRYGKELMYSLSNVAYSSRGDSIPQTNKNRFLPIVTARATSYSTVDVALKTVTKATTFYGHTIKYGKHSEDHKVGGTLTIEFRNDRFLSILKMMYLWMCYIWLVSKTGEIEPKIEYQQNGVLDYAASIYYVVVRRDNRELVFWEKITGVYPISDQFSIFSFSDSMIIQDRISIDFDFGMRSDPNDPEVLIDLNVLSGIRYDQMMKMTKFDMTNLSTSHGNRTLEQDPFIKGVGGIDNVAFAGSLEAPFALGNSFAECPFAHTAKMRDGSLRYYLDWIKSKV